MQDETVSARKGTTEQFCRDFEVLWREWWPRAIAYCRAFSRITPEEAQDLASEALLRAWSARERYDPSRPFAPWFLTILRRLILDSVSSGRETESPATIETALSFAYEAETGAMRDADEAFVQRFVAGLPERDHELASLVYGQNLTVAQAARVAGLPVGSAKWRLFEIRKALRKAWEREYGYTV